MHVEAGVAERADLRDPDALRDRPAVEEQDLHRSTLTEPSSSGASAHPVSTPSTRMTAASCTSSSRAGGRSAGDEAVWATRRTTSGFGSREPRDDGRIRRQPDDVSGRKRPVELWDREVLVDDPPSLEEDHPHELLTLDAEQQGHGPSPVGKLARKPSEHLRISIADVVVDRDPAASRRRDERATRTAGKSRDELPHCLLDGAQIV